MFEGKGTYESAIQSGEVVIDGKLTVLTEFLSVVDNREELPALNIALC